MPEDFDADKIANDLNDCRQRGLDWLDRSTTNQKPLALVALEQLAAEYSEARRLGATGRIGQIKALVRDGIAEFGRQGHVSEADLLRALFFGESVDGPIASPGVLLRKAQQKFGDLPDARFRELRTSVVRSFSRFLIGFVFPARAAGRAARDERQQLAAIGYLAEDDHFVQLLADAVAVTIVGVTNETLPRLLREGLRRKRDGGGREAFWQSLDIVFLSRTLLDAVNDEREELQDFGRSLGQRRQDAVWARRSVWDVLKRANSTNWRMYEYPYIPVLNGALLEFEDGSKIVRLVFRPPRRRSTEHLYIQFADTGDRFSAVFKEIVRNSLSANMIVPVGFPADSSFHYRGTRNQAEVLEDGSGGEGWLPMVMVITPRRVDDRTEAMLQLRTPENSARELSRLSHLAGYVLQDDRLRPAGRILAKPPASSGLTDETPLSAAQRIVLEVLAAEDLSAIRPVTTGRYLYPDKEHLFFFIFVLDLPEGVQFPRRAEMHTFPLGQLMTVRANRVFSSAAELCRTTDISERAWTAAAEVLALNLTLHDHAGIGDRLLESAGNDADLAATAAAIDRLVVVRTTPSLAEPGHDIQLEGLAGWQHREFFSVLLPLYADLGINGARELLEEVEHDARKSSAVSRLTELYRSEDSMAYMPMEL